MHSSTGHSPTGSTSPADHQQEPVFLAAVGCSTGPVGHHKPLQHTLVPWPATNQPQVPSSAMSSTQIQKPPQQAVQVGPPKHPTLVFSTGPTTTPLLSRASSWDTAPQASGDQGYVSPLIAVYPDSDMDLEALFDSPADRAPVSYDDLQ